MKNRGRTVQDWLAQFIVSWHQNTGKLPEGTTASHTDIDATLAAASPAIAALVPALHALLRSDPFSPERSLASADGTQALLLLWASLAPPDLLLCIYPMLVAVENVEHIEPARCPLSLASLRVRPTDVPSEATRSPCMHAPSRCHVAACTRVEHPSSQIAVLPEQPQTTAQELLWARAQYPFGSPRRRSPLSAPGMLNLHALCPHRLSCLRTLAA